VKAGGNYFKPLMSKEKYLYMCEAGEIYSKHRGARENIFLYVKQGKSRAKLFSTQRKKQGGNILM